VTTERDHELAAVSEGICPIHNGRLTPVHAIALYGRTVGRCADGGESWAVHRTPADDPLFHGEVVVAYYAAQPRR
jgi:hypothetical protein